MRRNPGAHFVALLFLFLLAISAAAQNSVVVKKNDKSPALPKDDEASVTSATNDPAYVIGSPDMLSVSVWKEPDISRSVPVRPDGKISLPLIDDVQAAGLTPTQLAASITEKLKKFLMSPQVTVIVTQINSQHIYILGEVSHPGSFSLLPDMRVLQALSRAGGFSEFANLKKIYVLRTESGKQIKYSFNYKEVLKGKKAQQNILLKSGDTIIVP